MKLTALINEGVAPKRLNEAEQIDFNKLDPQRKKQVTAFEKILDGKNSAIFQGIHGYVVNIKASGINGRHRFSDDIMKKLLAAKARWVEGGDETIIVGF